MNEISLFDFGVFPSIWEEPFGISHLEMMSSGLVVLSSGRGGSREIGVHMKDIFYYNPDSNTHLFELLDALLLNCTLDLQAVSSNAYSTIIKNFSYTAYNQVLSSIFDKCLT